MKSREQKKRQLKYLTVSAMLSALGVVLLGFGSLVEVLDLTFSAIASLLVVYAVIEMGGAYPWLIWLVTAVLSILLLPQKTPALFYGLFMGFYPMVKAKAEKLPRPLSALLKTGVFHLCLVAILLLWKLFFPAALEEYKVVWMAALLWGLAFFTFWVYDYALSRLITLYLLRLCQRFRIR